MTLNWLPVVVLLAGQAAPPPAQTPRPVPPLYNETATAQSVITKAVDGANTDGIRALVIWGANENDRCKAFEVTRRSRDVTPVFFSDEYKLAYVDVGKADKAVDVAKSYGVTLSDDALPFLTVLDQKGKVVANISSRELAAADGAGFDGKKLAAFLTKHQAPFPDANAQFAAGLKQAKATGKPLFLWYTAPWCGWCHRLGDWLELPEVAALMAKEFVILKLDFDRGIGAKEIQKRYIAQEQGLPWFVFLDVNGKPIINSSDRPEGNAGHPNSPDEVAHFKVMLQKVKKNLTDAEIAKLIEILVAENKKHG